MAEAANVNINLNSKADLKGFKKVETASQKLIKTTKKLAASLGIAYSAKAVLAYANASIKAAAADQKSQTILASNLKNLGLAYANIDAETFIKSMETQTHIADDLLRPAYAQLAQQTGSIAMTQKIMATAFDTANGAGLDFAQTVNILSLAYVGNRKGLKQLNIGLSQAELAGLSFDQLLSVLNQHFGGAGQAAVKGYAGQMDALTISLGNVQEILGGALLDSFAKLGGGGDITKATSKVEQLAEAFAGLLKVLTGVYDINAIMKQVEFGGFLGVVPRDKPVSYIPMQSPGDRAAIDKANAAAKKREYDAGAAGRKLAKAQTAALKLAKAKAIFDLQNIQIAAALKGKISDEDKIRLKLMQAIQDENLVAIDKFSKALDEAQKKTKELQASLDLAKAGFGNPFLEAQNGADALKKFINDMTPVGLYGSVTQSMLQKAYSDGFGGLNFFNPITTTNTVPNSNGGTINGNMVDVSGTGNNASNAAGTTVVNNNITVNGAVDAVGTANYLKQIIAQAANQVGSYQDWAQAYKGQSYAL